MPNKVESLNRKYFVFSAVSLSCLGPSHKKASLWPVEQVNPLAWKVIVTFEGKAAVSLTKVGKDFEPLSSAAFELVQQALRPLKKIRPTLVS